jgi:aerobic C4-dicarboxylate transport protein
MDSMRVVVNLLGNCVATFVVAKSEGQLDVERMRAVLVDGEAPRPDVDEVDEPVTARR